jgi:hypothetical protein
MPSIMTVEDDEAGRSEPVGETGQDKNVDDRRPWWRPNG